MLIILPYHIIYVKQYGSVHIPEAILLFLAASFWHVFILTEFQHQDCYVRATKPYLSMNHLSKVFFSPRYLFPHSRITILAELSVNTK